MPVVDGSASIAVTAGGKSASVPVVVSNMAKPDPVQFKFETVAVLTKQGCATGSCHGSPHGKGNFSLSLFGYDPSIDRVSLTRDGFNRRVNVMEPAESLMLKKPLMQVSHVGGKRLLKTDAAYRILFNWIYEGASTLLPPVECQKIVVYPTLNRILKAPFLKQQLSVLARYSDGTVRDVTGIATYSSSNHDIAEADSDGLVTGKTRGQAAISVRYLDKLESVFFTVIEDIPGFAWNNPPENNWIDPLVDEKLRQLQYLPSETCSDGTFIRRVYLDLTGLLPSAQAVRDFLADASPDKRAKLIDRLLDSEEFARSWAQKKADLMRVTTRALKNGRAELFADWIIDATRKNMPYDQFARQILTSRGSTRDVAPANYFEAVSTVEERTEMTAEIFMGSRLECSKCHNHPFENWTMKDYYSLAAVFIRTKDDGGEVTVTNTGEATHPTTGQVMTPWGMPQSQMKNDPACDRREAFVDWLTAKGNPYFARVEVNRIWAELLGRGIVDPVDDFRSSNPPVNVALLDALAKEFEASGYDRKHMIRLICNSRTYQRSTAANPFNESDDRLFSHGTIRLLTAEQLTDAIGLMAGSLMPPAVFAQRLAEDRRDLDARKAELDRGFDAWLAKSEEGAREAASWFGAWYSVGPFPFTGDPIKQALGPEKLPVELSQTFDNGKRPWRLRLDLYDSKSAEVLEGSNTVTYLYRRIQSSEDRVQRVMLLAGNNAVIWLNDERITKGPHKANSPIKLRLRTGENHLLVKCISYSDSRFNFDPTDDDGKRPAKDARRVNLPGPLIDVLTIPANSRTAAQRQGIHDYYLTADAKYRKLREQVQKLENRPDYATQRPVPDGNSAFLTVFGQPQRQTACTCERTSAPTLLQALELLNGNTVSSMVAASRQTYGKLSDDALIDELYLASYSRLPTEKDRATARNYLKPRDGKDRDRAITDLTWAIVNTREFLFQH